MDINQDYLETQFRFYEKVLNRYSKMSSLFSNEDNSRLSDQIKKIDEAFTDKIWAEASGIIAEYHEYQEYYKQNNDFSTFVKNKGLLTQRMAALDGNYRTKVSIWMDQLETELEQAVKNKTISKDVADEVRTVAKLSLDDYYTNSHAVVIGIDHYQNENPLKNAVNDAKSVASILREKYNFKNIIELYDKDATKSEIERTIDDVLSAKDKIGYNDRLLLYFSGHGTLRSDETASGGQIRDGYLLPVNAQKNTYSSYVRMDGVIESLQRCGAKHKLLILDCCYSGFAALRATGEKESIGNKTTEEYIRDITSKEAIQVIAAGEDDQPVCDSGISKGHSAFTGALLEILEQAEDIDHDGLLTAGEIGTLIIPTVANHLGKQAALQVPVYTHVMGSKLGNFVFKILSEKKG